MKSTKSKAGVIVCVLLVVTGIACLIAGVVLLNKSGNTSKSTTEENQPPCTNETKSNSTSCEYSSEAVRVKLPEFLQKVKDAYYEHHPYKLLDSRFMPYDPSPSKLKNATDTSLKLLQELQSKKIIKHKLKPRERKAIAQMMHYLQHSFGTPFAGNFYGGDYLLGPDMFCWQPMCQVYRWTTIGLRRQQLVSIADVEVLLGKIKSLNHTFVQYKANLIYGVKAGMVRSTEPCKVGADALIQSMKGALVEENAQGILKSEYGNLIGDSFLSKLTAETKKSWKDKKGKEVKDSVREYVVEYIGKPMKDLVTYLQTTYLQHCAPSGVTSGLATLPIAHVYENGTITSQIKNSFLPDGTPLNGSKAYEYLLSYFSTTSITPNEVQTLGYNMVDKLYSQIIDLAKQYTGKSDNDTARDLFKEKLNSSDFYYDTPIPEIESNATAHQRCTKDESAKMHCPTRWKIIQQMFGDLNKIMSMLDGATVEMFYFTGSKHTTPNCPISLRPNYNPNMGVPSYSRSTQACKQTAYYNVPFFLTRPGPKFNQFSVNSHEARPGHHTQVQGHVEHFQDSCGGLIGWLGSQTRFTAFVEGWGLYAETPLIGADTKVYDGRPTDKYGMIRSQLWRALRLVVDTGLHFTGFSRQKAMQYFIDYAWVNDDVLKKEITRYQSNPGQATSYMIGGQHIIKLRTRAEKELQNKFNLKEFHYHLLRDGSAPLSFLTESIDDYIRCTKDTTDEGCVDILSVQNSGSTSNLNRDMEMDVELLPKYLSESYY